VVTGIVVVALVAGGIGLSKLRRDDRPALPASETDAYLAAWARFDTDALAALVVDPPATFAADHQAMHERLLVKEARFTRRSLVRVDSNRARAGYHATLGLAGLGEWSYDGTITLAHRDKRWMVEWSPATIHPDMQAGLSFDRARTRPNRASIFGTADEPLASSGETVAIGVEPRRVKDRAAVAGALAEHAGVAPEQVTAALARPGVRPDAFVPFAQLPRDRFDLVRPVLEPVPGIVFRKQAGRVTTTEDFARHLLGRTGPITAEMLDKLGEPYMAGDTVGFDGLEGAYERQLAGSPSGEVRLVDGGGAVVRTLQTFAGSGPQPVVTTIDPAVQGAAEQALAGVDKPAAIVAVDGLTGSVLAVASRPLTDGFDRALLGRYPPGSTFKVVTTSALLENGTKPSSPVTCPATRAVEGKTFKNFEEEALGDITLEKAFAESCNTAFVGLAEQLGADRLKTAAGHFGFNDRYELGLPSVHGSFPDPADRAETAAAGIGQARVEASPLHMATVAAAVASGTWRRPTLVVDRSQPAGSAAGLGAGAQQLDAPMVATLRNLMASVVRTGSGKAAAAPGSPPPSGNAGAAAFGGKTGTAEFGSGSPLPTHAWFIGFKGTVGFAVLVESGGVGGRVAAPIAGRFVVALPAGAGAVAGPG